MKLRRFALLALPLAGAVAPMSLPRLANAAGTIIPDTNTDVASPNCGLGHPAGSCSLRGAVDFANLSSGGDTIQLNALTYTLTIAPGGTDDNTGGDLELTQSMTIQGAGAGQTIITASGSPWPDRIIEVDPLVVAPTVTISDLTVTGGNTLGNEGDGGGILNDASTLTLHNVVVDKNKANVFSGSGFNGGGVASESGTLTMTNSTISNNEAVGSGGGLYLFGPTTAANSFSNMLVTGNTADQGVIFDAGGGGIYDGLTNGGGSASFTDLMVTKNHAPAMSGGGIYEENGLAGGAIYSKVTLSKNDAKNFGGGIYVNVADTGATTVTMTNATITGNSVSSVSGDGQPAGSGSGGGVGLLVQGTASLTLNNATISGNTSTQPGAGVAEMASGDTVQFHNTLVVQNTDTTAGATSNCSAGSSGGALLVSRGYNLADDTTCAFTGTGDRQGSTFNPNLGPLQDNTGPTDGAPGATSPTLTEALPSGSIAIDTADPAGANNPATDERGVTRPQGAQSDVGAYEAIPPVFVAPGLPAAGHAGSGSQSSGPWALLILAATTTLGAVGLRGAPGADPG
jgi:hypothetical protein